MVGSGTQNEHRLGGSVDHSATLEQESMIVRPQRRGELIGDRMTLESLLADTFRTGTAYSTLLDSIAG